VPINLPTFSELPAQLPAQKPVRTAPTQTSLIRCSKLIPNRRRGGFPTPRAQFINNGFGLGEFFGKRGLMVLAVSSECAVWLFELRHVSRHNFPRSVFPHPDICALKFSTERLACFVLACLMVDSIADREVLTVHTHVKG